MYQPVTGLYQPMRSLTQGAFPSRSGYFPAMSQNRRCISSARLEAEWACRRRCGPSSIISEVDYSTTSQAYYCAVYASSRVVCSGPRIWLPRRRCDVLMPGQFKAACLIYSDGYLRPSYFPTYFIRCVDKSVEKVIVRPSGPR